MDSLISFFIIIVLSAFPIIVWGYGTLYLSSNVWNRARFIFGMGAGSLALLVIAIFRGMLGGSILFSIIGFFGVLALLTVLVWMMTIHGSAFIRGFLRKVIVLHSFLFFGLFASFLILCGYIGNIESLSVLLASLGGFLIAASVEEGVKHMSSIGLTAREFRFTRRDFLLFTFFVTLGFVTLENGIYMIREIESGPIQVLTTGLSRPAFALPLHVFAASICVMMWWQALSYRFFSWRYVSLFSLGYIMATVVHGTYNLLIDYGYIIPVILLMGIGYFAFTQWIIED